MIFVDTSAFFALADVRDPAHRDAESAFTALVEHGEDALTHSYVLAEATALLQNRLGLGSALQFLEQSRAFQIHWIEREDHDAAVALLAERNRRGLSLVDCASFVVMHRYDVTQALAFDGDFEAEGFSIYRADGA